MILSIVIILIYLPLMIILCGCEMEALMYYIDMPSILLLLLMSIILMIANGQWKSFCNAVMIACKTKNIYFTMSDLKKSLCAVEFAEKSIIYSSIMIMIFEAIVVLHILMEPEKIGPTVAVILIVLFYMSILELLLLPVKAAVKNKIADYMEGED